MFIDFAAQPTSGAPEERNVSIDETLGSATFRSSGAGNLIDQALYKHYVPPGLSDIRKLCSKNKNLELVFQTGLNGYKSS